MKTKYIIPKIRVHTMNFTCLAGSITATGPDCPWDNEDGEKWGSNAKKKNNYIFSFWNEDDVKF